MWSETSESIACHWATDATIGEAMVKSRVESLIVVGTFGTLRRMAS